MSRALALALLAAVLGGCASSDVNRIRRDLQPQLEAQAELGRASSVVVRARLDRHDAVPGASARALVDGAVPAA